MGIYQGGRQLRQRPWINVLRWRKCKSSYCLSILLRKLELGSSGLSRSSPGMLRAVPYTLHSLGERDSCAFFRNGAKTKQNQSKMRNPVWICSPSMERSFQGQTNQTEINILEPLMPGWETVCTVQCWNSTRGLRTPVKTWQSKLAECKE